MKTLTLLLTLLTVAGCAQQRRPVKIALDTYCQTAEKVRWSVTDDRRTIQDARRENAKLDRCPKKKRH